MKPLEIFTTPIWHIPVEESDKEVIGKLYDWAIEIREKNPGAKISNRGGFHSNYPPIIEKDYKFIPDDGLLNKKLNFLPDVDIQSWWVLVNEKGDYNIQHTHPGSDLSLIWYLTDNNNSLKLVDPMLQSRYKFPEIFPNQHTTYDWDCLAGDILIFPADIPHSVERHELNTPRVSLVMNLELVRPLNNF
tara:strand:+ start:838 stop:1404 length:567 start_codon:yes stop_codon:yes gene_type:complete